MFHATQCTHVPPGASGSSTTSAYVAARGGAPLHESAGDTFAPSAVNFAGIDAPSLNAVLSRRSDFSTPPSGPSPSSADPHATSRKTPASATAMDSADLTTCLGGMVAHSR